MKLRASVFRKAMRLLPPSEEMEDKKGYSSEFACHCIDCVAHGHNWSRQDDSPEHVFFEHVYGCQLGETFKGLSKMWTIEEVYPLRIMALELAALLVEDGQTLEDFT